MSWSRWTSDDGDYTAIWYGEQETPVFCDPATTPWQELYHEEDYRGISDQLLAEDLGYA